LGVVEKTFEDEHQIMDLQTNIELMYEALLLDESMASHVLKVCEAVVDACKTRLAAPHLDGQSCELLQTVTQQAISLRKLSIMMMWCMTSAFGNLRELIQSHEARRSRRLAMLLRCPPTGGAWHMMLGPSGYSSTMSTLMVSQLCPCEAGALMQLFNDGIGDSAAAYLVAESVIEALGLLESAEEQTSMFACIYGCENWQLSFAMALLDASIEVPSLQSRAVDLLRVAPTAVRIGASQILLLSGNAHAAIELLDGATVGPLLSLALLQIGRVDAAYAVRDEALFAKELCFAELWSSKQYCALLELGLGDDALLHFLYRRAQDSPPGMNTAVSLLIGLYVQLGQFIDALALAEEFGHPNSPLLDAASSQLPAHVAEALRVGGPSQAAMAAGVRLAPNPLTSLLVPPAAAPRSLLLSARAPLPRPAAQPNHDLFAGIGGRANRRQREQPLLTAPLAGDALFSGIKGRASRSSRSVIAHGPTSDLFSGIQGRIPGRAGPVTRARAVRSLA
jgi:hypothetical protein